MQSMMSSADEGNRDYNIFQKTNSNKREKVFYNVTLLVKNLPINFIIDSQSPVTSNSNCLFNKITKVETSSWLMLTNTKSSSISITIEKTKAVVETNKKTICLQLLITKINEMSPLLGLDWMPLECTGKPYLLKAQHSAFNISDSTTIALTVQNWQITSFVPDSTDLVVDSSNKCLAVRTVGMQRCPGFHKNVSFAN